MAILLLICGTVAITAVTFAFSRAEHPWLSAVRSAVTGIGALFFINITSSATGCYIAVNSRTVFISTVLSLPGVLALLVMKIIFNY